MKKRGEGEMPVASKENKLWQARSDARILADAEAIMIDTARVKAAAVEAKKMMDEVSAQVKTLSKVSKKTPRTPTTKRGR